MKSQTSSGSFEWTKSTVPKHLIQPSKDLSMKSISLKKALESKQEALDVATGCLNDSKRLVKSLQQKIDDMTARIFRPGNQNWRNDQADRDSSKTKRDLITHQKQTQSLPAKIKDLQASIINLKRDYDKALDEEKTQPEKINKQATKLPPAVKQKQSAAAARSSNSPAAQSGAPKPVIRRMVGGKIVSTQVLEVNNSLWRQAMCPGLTAPAKQLKPLSNASSMSTTKERVTIARKRKADVSAEPATVKRFKLDSSALSKPAMKETSPAAGSNKDDGFAGSPKAKRSKIRINASSAPATEEMSQHAGDKKAGVSNDRTPMKETKTGPKSSPTLTKEKMAQIASKRKADVSENAAPAKKIKLNKAASSVKLAAEKNSHADVDCSSISSSETTKNGKLAASKASSKFAEKRGAVNASGVEVIDGIKSEAGATQGEAKASAMKYRKKRSRPDDQSDSDSEQKRMKQMLSDESLSDESEELGWVAPKKRITTHLHAKGTEGFNGLLNHDNACFANVVIQLLDASFDGHDMDALLIENEEIDISDLTTDNIKHFHAETSVKESATRALMKSRLWKNIKKVANKGRNGTVSAVKHFRTLIGKLRTRYDKAPEQEISPILFQSIFAYGAKEDVDESKDDPSSRQIFDGNSQQDAFEYYQRVLNVIKSDTSVRDIESLRGLFELRCEAVSRCGSCKTESAPKEVPPPSYLDVTVPEEEGAKSCSLRELMEKSMTSVRDDHCESCGEAAMEQQTTLTGLPENLVVRLNRTKYAKDSKQATKVMTAVDVENSITLNGIEYQLNAVIRHQGPTIEGGHYTIFRKQGYEWYELDDKNCSLAERKDLQDNDYWGQSAMILFKKVKK